MLAKTNDIFNWDLHIPSVLFAYRIAKHSTTKYTPFYLNYGRNPVLPLELENKEENSVVNEMKGLLSSRPNTIGFIIYRGKKGNTEIMTETANSDIFVCHIEELHTLRSQIENKHLKKGIKTTAVTRIHMDEIEDAEFDNLGRITKARKIKNVNIQSWETTIYQNEDILFK